MFNETESHKEELHNGQKRLRIGHSVPKDAISLAYLHSQALQVDENILVTDIAQTISENSKGNKEGVIELWPNDQGLLRTWDGEESIGTRNVLLTNRFEKGIPLYYVHISKFLIYRGANASLKDLQNNITLVDASGRELDSSKIYKLYFSPSGVDTYRIHLFTNFQAQPIDNIKMFYTAWVDGKARIGHSEVLQPQEAFTRADSLHNVSLGINEYSYFRSDSKRIGESKIYVEGVPLKDMDYRQPLPFRYRLTGVATSEKGVITRIQTPWIYESIYCEKQLSVVDDYYRDGWKDLNRGESAQETLSKYGDITPFNSSKSNVVILAESSKADVDIYVQQEGRTPVRARTKVKTGFLPEPDEYKTEYRAKRYTVDVWIQLNSEEPMIKRIKISPLDGDLLVAGPFNGKVISVRPLREEDPITIYVANNSVYAYTNILEAYHVPKYAAYIQSNNQVQVLRPPHLSEKDNWYLRVKNGQFRKTGSSSTEPVDYFYSLPEYYSQGFNSELGMPYKKVTNERPELIGSNKIKTINAPLKIQKRESGINIQVHVNGKPVEAIGWTEENGIIDLNANLKEIDRIEVSYEYEELAYSYKGYLDDKGRYWHLDLNPGPGHMYTEMDVETGEISEQPTFNLINKTVYIYMRPSAIFDNANHMVKGSYAFETIYHSFEPIHSSTDVLLARINVRPNSNKEDIKIVDTRMYGGGIIPTISTEDMKRKEKESTSYWDVGGWDGEPLSLNGIIVVRLPRSILSKYGGSLNEKQVEDSVKRHMAYGSLPIIEYLDDAKRLIELPERLSASKEEDS